MRQFEFKDGKSAKFWNIEVTGSSVSTHWGRIGSKGQSKTKDFDDAAAAKKEAEKQIKTKTQKGYGEVDSDLLAAAVEVTSEGPVAPVEVPSELPAVGVVAPVSSQLGLVLVSWCWLHSLPTLK